MHSVTYPFKTNIKKIESANIAYGIYQRGSHFTFDEGSNKITNVYGDINLSTIFTNGVQNKSYTVNNGGNKFIVVGDNTNIKVYALDANNKITSVTPTDTKTISIPASV